MLHSRDELASLANLFKQESLSTLIPKWSVDPQASCHLFSRLPLEIRLQIFSLVFAEEQVPFDRDGNRLYPFPEPAWSLQTLSDDAATPPVDDSDLEHYTDVISNLEGGDWLRPGTTGRIFQHTSLLLTCRRVFIEARDLLMENATIRFFEGNYNAPPKVRLSRNMDIFHMSRYAANRITSFHLFMSMHVLELGYLSHRAYDLCPAQDLRITVRQCDWWQTDPSPPQITPFGVGCVNRFTPKEMENHMELTKDHGLTDARPPIPPIPFGKGSRSPRGAWGASLSRMPRLRRFTMDFEYSEERLTELQKLAEWAHRVWRFRLGGHMKGYYLSAEGNPIKKVCWRGLPSHWLASNWRHICSSHLQQLGVEEGPGEVTEDNRSSNATPSCCARRRKLISGNIGPMMYTFTVTWTARKLKPEDGDDPRILGPGELSDQWIELPNDGVVQRLDMDDCLGWPNSALLHPDSYPSLLDCPFY